jgi:hypothetical protein
MIPTFFHTYFLANDYFTKFLNIYIKLHDNYEIINKDDIMYAKVKDREIYNWSYNPKTMELKTDLGKVSIDAMIR